MADIKLTVEQRIDSSINAKGKRVCSVFSTPFFQDEVK